MTRKEDLRWQPTTRTTTGKADRWVNYRPDDSVAYVQTDTDGGEAPDAIRHARTPLWRRLRSLANSYPAPG